MVSGLSTIGNAALSSRFSQQLDEPSLVVAAAVHPRFKFYWLQGAERKRAISLVKEEYAAMAPVGDDAPADDHDGSGTESADEFFDLDCTPAGHELDRWRKSPRGSLSTLDDFPIVKMMFLKFNTSIPSSAPVERLFSVGRDVFGLKRGKLTDNNFERQLLLKCNRNS